MSAAPSHAAGQIGGAHPAVVRQRIRGLALAAAAVLVPLAMALFISDQVARPNWLLTGAVIVGACVLMFLIFNSRLEVSVAVLGVYLACMDGPVKLFSGGGTSVSVLRDVLIYSVAAGALARLAVRREPIRLPPLTAWVLVFVALVLVEALNPNTNGTLKILGGYRQQLEWVPFFFFGYAVMRSTRRFRQLFVLLALVALANGAVSAYQSRLSPQQMASWGPGYAEKVLGTGGVSGTTYSSEGEGHVRPLGLGSDVGFAGSVGMITLPAVLALLATARWRRRWVLPLLAIGPLLGIATAQQRTSVLGALAALIGFGLFSLSAGRQVIRPLLAMGAVLLLGVGVVTVLSSTEGSSAFARLSSIAPEKVASTAPDYKEVSLKQIPNDIANDPFGFGLGTAGAASGFGGRTTVQLEGHGFSSETEFNFIMNEVGLPGLVLWVAFMFMLLWMAATRLRNVPDVETRIDLAAVFAALCGFALTGFAGAFSAGQIGAYFWFIAGVAAYWLAGPGQAPRLPRREPAGGASPTLTPSPA